MLCTTFKVPDKHMPDKHVHNIGCNPIWHSTHLTSISVQMMTATMSAPTVMAIVRPNSGSTMPEVSSNPVQSNC